MGATCKDCRKTVTWAADGGRTLPFESSVYGPGAVAISKAGGTYRVRRHPGHPHVPAYRRHNCRRRK